MQVEGQAVFEPTALLLRLLGLLAHLPLPALRALGRGLGVLLWWAVPRRRHVVRRNLALCFAQCSAPERDRLARTVFTCFAQAWLDRAWLWRAAPSTLRRRLRIEADPATLAALRSDQPLVLFAPHFMGLDAGWTALALGDARPLVTIYTDQSNPVADAWIAAGRRRLGRVGVFGRADGVKPIVAALRDGAALYLLPDMNFGPHESLWVPFFGVTAATVPSLSRFARLGRARVHSAVTRLAPHGYTLHIGPAWADFPTADLQADTARMNRELQSLIDLAPAEYYWVHQRFKDRPPGEPGVY